jgi:4-diphosphocytidyl-2-C-methyl-D-erythritol kinase
VIVRAPAKVNLVLRVGPVRDDGYHRLATLFQAIDVYDEIELSDASETVVEGFEDTLITAALAALGETRHVRLTKGIPVAAGLGGGSSDAAAVLRAFSAGRDVNELYGIARSLGADVPFFLSGCETALGTGRGDRIEPLPDFPRGHAFVLLPEAEGLSTAEVYAGSQPNEVFEAVRGDLIRAVHITRTPADVGRMLANDLQPAALALRPALQRNIERLLAAGALGAQVSGSGPTTFGVFEDRAAAQRAAIGLQGSSVASPL